MTNKEIINIHNNIRSLENKYPNIFKGNATALFALLRNKRSIEMEMTTYQETYQKLGNEFVTDEKTEPVLDENGNEIDVSIKREYQQEWADRLKELDNIDIDVKIHKVKLEDVAGDDLTFDMLEKIAFMIEDE